MPIDFPDSPSVNDQFLNEGRTWIWNGSVWRAAATAAQVISNSTITSAMIVDGTIVNADIASAAAIDTGKITNWENDQVVLPNQIFG